MPFPDRTILLGWRRFCGGRGDGDGGDLLIEGGVGVGRESVLECLEGSEKGCVSVSVSVLYDVLVYHRVCHLARLCYTS